MESASLFEQVLQNKESIGGPLRQTPHEVRIPLRPKGDIHAHPPAILDKLALKIAPDSIEHLELKSIGWNLFSFGEFQGRCNHLLVVLGHAVIDTPLDQHLHEPYVVLVDLRHLLESQLRRLLISALAQPDPNSLLQQLFNIFFTAAHISLDDGADVAPVSILAVQLTNEIQCALRIG